MSNNTLHKLGIDIGSTTVKVAVLDENDNLLFSDYERQPCAEPFSEGLAR